MIRMLEHWFQYRRRAYRAHSARNPNRFVDTEKQRLSFCCRCDEAVCITVYTASVGSLKCNTRKDKDRITVRRADLCEISSVAKLCDNLLHNIRHWQITNVRPLTVRFEERGTSIAYDSQLVLSRRRRPIVQLSSIQL